MHLGIVDYGNDLINLKVGEVTKSVVVSYENQTHCFDLGSVDCCMLVNHLIGSIFAHD